MAISLRDATVSDAERLGALHAASWRETYTGLLPEDMLARLSVEARSAMWAKILAEGGRDAMTVHVAECDGRMIGFGSCGRQRDRRLEDLGFDAEINAIYVLRAHQRMGVGRSVMRRMANLLDASGYAAATLWVLRENAIARDFYTHLGGEPVAEREDHRATATLREIAYGWRSLERLS